MASLFSVLGFDITNIDFNRVIQGEYNSGLYSNSNYTWYGITYQDSAEFDWSYNGSSTASIFAGYNITVDSSGNVTGGTVTGYFEYLWNGSAWVPSWGIQGISISATTLASAFLTPSTA